MIAKIEKIAEDLKLESRRIRHDAVARMRALVLETAGAISRSKKPVRTLGSTGLKLNTISHKSLEKLLKTQIDGIEELVDGGAQRLELAANAGTFGELWKGQLDAMPATRTRAIAHARRTIEIVRDTGDELTGAVRAGIAGAPKAKTRKAPAKKAAARKATARKATTRKAASRKKTATRKASTRKAPAASGTVSRKTTAKAA
jgi:hypothetical protein